jgi:glutathione S-transferase
MQSGAIIEYLIATYDKDAKLHYTSSPEKFQTLTWAHFQMSGQGPYFGQKVWFTRYHSEKIDSAIARYSAEIKRVLGVIDSHLKKQGTDYLVGDRVTYADLMFIPWSAVVPGIAPELDLSELQHYNAWFKRITERPSVVKVLADKAAAA